MAGKALRPCRFLEGEALHAPKRCGKIPAEGVASKALRRFCRFSEGGGVHGILIFSNPCLPLASLLRSGR